MTDIVNGLTAKGMDTKTATKLAKQYQAFLNNEMRMTDEQVKILENLSPLADTLRTEIIGANTTVYQRTRAYSDIMNLADEVANRSKGKKAKATATASKASTQQAENTSVTENATAKEIATESEFGAFTERKKYGTRKIIRCIQAR